MKTVLRLTKFERAAFHILKRRRDMLKDMLIDHASKSPRNLDEHIVRIVGEVEQLEDVTRKMRARGARRAAEHREREQRARERALHHEAIPIDFSVNELCECELEHGQWVRAKVFAVSQDGWIGVSILDYGTQTRQLPLSRVRKLPEKLPTL